MENYKPSEFRSKSLGFACSLESRLRKHTKHQPIITKYMFSYGIFNIKNDHSNDHGSIFLCKDFMLLRHACYPRFDFISYIKSEKGIELN